jgi:tRNA nucleotidyltransferase (CCA-adding enzyme)
MKLTPDRIPPEITDVCRRLRQAGYQALLVGGAVRDHLRMPAGQAVAKDFDIATSAHPEEVIRLFGRRHTVPTGIQHGTVTVLVPRPGAPPGAPREHVEVTTFRGEGAYSDGRRPDQVAFIDDLTEDLRRRDFTINAIAYDPIEDELRDPFDGMGDLQRRLIRAVGDPAARFGEDGLRTMRAVRFAAQLGFLLHEGTKAAIPGALPTLRKVSWERIRDELLKLLGAPAPSSALSLMAETGLLHEVLPPVAAAPADAVAQALRTVDLLRRDPILRLGALLAVAPGEAAEQALVRLKLPNRDQDRLLQLLRTPAPAYDASWTGAQVRRFLAATPAQLRGDMEALLRGQHEAAGRGAAFEAGLGALFRRAGEELAARPALSIGELVVSGKDVMAHLGVPPGPLIGEVLRALFERVLEDPALNTRERALSLVQEIYAARVTMPGP